MAEILPTPGAGTILRLTPQGPPWTPQPLAGTILRLTPQGPNPSGGTHRMVMTAGMAPR